MLGAVLWIIYGVLIGASPVVLSFISRPVIAAPGSRDCRAPSAFASFTANPLTSRSPASQCLGSDPTSLADSLQALGTTPTPLRE